MKKQTKSIILSISAAILLTACGSESSSETYVNNESKTTSSPTPTNITVERGKVYGATVKDNFGNIATQTNGENIYVFNNKVNYPIFVTGGWIDVDGDNKKTTKDVNLTATLKSNSNNVTAITTYLSNLSDDEIENIATKFDISKEDLNKIPSSTSNDLVALNNALYKHIKLNTNLSNINIDNVKTDFDNYKTTISQNPDKNLNEIAIIVENEVINDSSLSNKISHISLSDSELTDQEKIDESMGNEDFVLDNAISFNTITNAEISTQLESNEVTFTGIDTNLEITIDNNQFTIVKNDVEIDGLSTIVSNNDKIKLKATSSSLFDASKKVTLTIKDKFTNELFDLRTKAKASEICSNKNLQIPSKEQLKNHYQSNPNNFTFSKYWISETSYAGAMSYIVKTDNMINDILYSSKNAVVCVKTYSNKSYDFTITTKSDPNEAPISKAGVDQTIYYIDEVTLDGTSSSDDKGISSFEWKEGNTILSTEEKFTKTDFSVGTHTINLTVTDDEGKNSTDTVIVKIFDKFTDILSMDEVGSIKSVSNINGLKTLGAGSQLYFKITNDLERSFTVSKFEVYSYFNGLPTLRASSTNSSLLSNGTLTPNEYLTLGYSLVSSQTAHYWIGTYTLTDIDTGETFTNSLKW